MDKRTPIILFLIFFALSAALLLKSKVKLGTGAEPFKKMKITGIDIAECKKDPIKLRKEKKDWYIGMWPADPVRINNVLDSVQKISLGDIISVRREKYADFEVTRSSGIVVNLIGLKKNSAKLYIGKRSSEWVHSYLRIEGNPAVYLVSMVNKSMFNVSESFWKDKRIIRTDIEQLKSVGLHYENKKYTIYKDTVSWVKTTNVLKNIKAIGFHEDIKNYKGFLKNPYIKIELSPEKGSEKGCSIIKQENKYFAKPSGMEVVYEVSAENVKELLKEIKNGSSSK